MPGSATTFAARRPQQTQMFGPAAATITVPCSVPLQHPVPIPPHLQALAPRVGSCRPSAWDAKGAYYSMSLTVSHMLAPPYELSGMPSLNSERDECGHEDTTTGWNTLPAQVHLFLRGGGSIRAILLTQNRR